MSQLGDGEKRFQILRASPGLASAASALLLAVVAWLDFATGKDASFTLLYLVPITTAAWFAGARTGLLFSLLAATCELAVELISEQPSLATACWNTGVKFGVYLAFCALLDYVKTHDLGLSVLVGVQRRLGLGVALACVLALAGGALQWAVVGRYPVTTPAASAAIHTNLTPGSATSLPAGASAASPTRQANPLAELATLVQACMRSSRPVLLGSRDPKTSTCVPVVHSGDLSTALPDNPGDLNGGPGTTLATIYFFDRQKCKTPLQDFAWHQGRLKTFLENEASLDRPAGELAHQLAEVANRFCTEAQSWRQFPEGLSRIGFASDDDWPSYCLTELDKAVTNKDVAAIQRWAGELAAAAFSLDDLHRWLSFLVENHLAALAFQKRCEPLFAEADALHRDYDPNGTISQFPAGVLSLNGRSNYYEVERQAERLFSVPTDGMVEFSPVENPTPGALWVSPDVRELFQKLGAVLSADNRKTWELAARTPFEHSYLINMLFRAEQSNAANDLCDVLKKFDAVYPHARVGELMSVLMFRGHSFAGLEWGDRFRPELLKAADQIKPAQSDLDALQDACRWTNNFYTAPAEYGVTFTLRDALQSNRLDCVRSTDMIGAIFRNAGRAGFGHVRWCAATGGHSVAAYLRSSENEKGQPRLFDGLMPMQEPEVWPECYFHGHAWPPSLANQNNTPPYAAELYVRGIDSYIWAEGYIIRGPNAGWLTTTGIPYSLHRRETATRKVFDGPYPQ